MATNYPHPIKIHVSLIRRTGVHPCCADYHDGNECSCGPLVGVKTVTRSSAAELREKHYFDASNIWNAQNTIKEQPYNDDYVSARLGR